jgi:hypothetical protein
MAQTALAETFADLPKRDIRQKNQPKKEGCRNDLEPGTTGNVRQRCGNRPAMKDTNDHLLYDRKHDHEDEKDE